MEEYKCIVCGYIYRESAGIPGKGIAPGTKWEDLPDDFLCPLCSAPKAAFVKLLKPSSIPAPDTGATGEHAERLSERSAGEISAICSNLAKGCEKQRLLAEMEAFQKIADYYKAKGADQRGKNLEDIKKALGEDLNRGFPAAKAVAEAAGDRGALRSLVWAEKVSAMTKMLLDRFAKEGDAMLKDTKVFVCDICGFIYLGDRPPEVCPVCKVPNFRIIEVERRESHAGL